MRALGKIDGRLNGLENRLGNVNDHLDELNGKVADNVEEIQSLKTENELAEQKRQSFEDWQKNRSKWWDWVVKGVVGILGTIVLLAILSSLQNVNILQALM